MDPIGLIKCLFGKHERSRSGAVRYMDNSVLSTCRNCGRKMYRHPREGWKAERRKQQRCFEPADQRTQKGNDVE